MLKETVACRAANRMLQKTSICNTTRRHPEKDIGVPVYGTSHGKCNQSLMTPTTLVFMLIVHALIFESVQEQIWRANNCRLAE